MEPNFSSRYPLVDVRALTADVGVDFDSLRAALVSFYADIDKRNENNVGHLALPCAKGCSACCYECVFLSPLEFLVAWDWAQDNLDARTLETIIDAGLALCEQHRDVIAAFDEPPPEGASDHFKLARDLRFRCPFLSQEEHCLIYPMRELGARLFGSSFNEGGGVYGCEKVGKYLAGQTVTLISAHRASQRLLELPFGNKRQVHPYYLRMLFTDPAIPRLVRTTARA